MINVLNNFLRWCKTFFIYTLCFSVESGRCKGILQTQNRLPHKADRENSAGPSGKTCHETRWARLHFSYKSAFPTFFRHFIIFVIWKALHFNATMPHYLFSNTMDTELNANLWIWESVWAVKHIFLALYPSILDLKLNECLLMCDFNLSVHIHIGWTGQKL